MHRSNARNNAPRNGLVWPPINTHTIAPSTLKLLNTLCSVAFETHCCKLLAKPPAASYAQLIPLPPGCQPQPSLMTEAELPNSVTAPCRDQSLVSLTMGHGCKPAHA